MSQYKVAVVGATGTVGREMLMTLAERKFPASKVYAIASESSIGKEVSYGENETLNIEALPNFDFSKADIALFSAGSDVSKKYAPKIAEKGCTVIDNSSAFRMDPEVPLVVPEVNGDILTQGLPKNIIANPNCSTIQLVMALKPLQKLSPVKRVVASTYQSVSGAGRKAMDELFAQTRAIFVNDVPEKSCFTKQIAFNTIPQIGAFMDTGDTHEERKMVEETPKIMGCELPLAVTCVRVPVFTGHAVSATIEFESEVSVAAARKALKAFPGVSVIDHHLEVGFVTQDECVGEDMVYVSRIRKDPTVPHGLSLWIVADNLRKGAALNAVQIAEEIIK